MFAGSLCELGVDHEEKKPKTVSKKKVVTVAEGARPKKPEATGAASDAASCKGTARPQQRNLDDFVYVAYSLEELYSTGLNDMHSPNCCCPKFFSTQQMPVLLETQSPSCRSFCQYRGINYRV